MGTRAIVAPANSDSSIVNLGSLNNRIYSVSSSGNVFKLNVSETAWGSALPVASPSGSQYIFTNHDSKLFINDVYSSTAHLYRINDTEDGVQTVVNNASYGWLTGMCSYNGRLYCGIAGNISFDTYVARLNLAEDDWEILCAAPDLLLSPFVLDGRLYYFCFDNTIYRLNTTYDGLETICSSAYPSYPKCKEVYDGNLYFGSGSSVRKLRTDLSAVDTLFSNNGTTYDLTTYGSKLYMGSLTMLQMNDTEDGYVDLWDKEPYPSTENIQNFVQNNSKLYFSSSDGPGILYKYVSMYPDFIGIPLSGFQPVTVSFTSLPYSDFPVTNYSWDFGDSGTSTDANPSHEFNSINDFTVTATYTNTVETLFEEKVDYISVADPTPIYITTIEELQLIGNHPSYPNTARYVLANDISAFSTSSWNGGLGFEPISDFKGELDGAGHYITGLVINRPVFFMAAIFQQTHGAYIHDVKISSASVTGGSGSSLLVSQAYQNTRFYNCEATGNIQGSSSSQCGGLLAAAQDDVMITDCTVIVFIDNCQAGGLVGNIYGSDPDNLLTVISGCTVTSIITNVIGQAGGISIYASNAQFNNCHAITTIDMDTGAGNVGGFVGFASNCKFDSCHSGGQIRMTDMSMNTLGGFIGYCSSNFPVTNCYSNVRINTYLDCYMYSIAGFIGYASTDIDNCYSMADLSISHYNNSSNWIAGFCAYAGKSVTNCHSTSNVAVTTNENQRMSNVTGFIAFASMSSADFYNCYCTGNVVVTSGENNDYIAGFVGYGNLGDIVDCYSTGNVYSGGTGYDSTGVVGGFGAYINVDTMSRCHSTGDVSGHGKVGGFCGDMSANVICSVCYSTGNVESKQATVTADTYTGGFVGRAYGRIENCYAQGDVINRSYSNNRAIGGFCGILYHGSFTPDITNCYSSGNVSEEIVIE